MKLQTPIQNRDTQQSETSKKLLRIQETEHLASEANQKLAKYEADFASAMVRNQELWLKEEENHQKMVKERTDELEMLEKRKEQALIPIEIYQQKADEIMQDALDFQEKLKEKEEKLEEQFDLLSKKLSAVEEKEEDLRIREQRLNQREESIKIQSEQTAVRAEQLTEQILVFHEKQKSDLETLEQRKKEVTLAEISFNAKIEKYNRDIALLKDFEIKLKDREATLEREIRRISPYKTETK